MSYTLGSFVALVGGGYVTANQRPGTLEGTPTIELFIQLYDAARQPISGQIVIGRAYANPVTGQFSTLVGVDLAAAPLGGFGIVYSGAWAEASHAQVFNFISGQMWDARGIPVHAFSYRYTPETLTAPHLIPLVNGGVIVQQERSSWFFDANGRWLAGLASPSTGEFYDLVTIIAQYTTRPDGTIDQWLMNGSGMVSSTAIVKSVTGGAGDDVLAGSTGPDIIWGGAGDDTLRGGFGFDVLSGGAGADRFVLGLDGSIDRITDFDTTQDKLQLTDLQGGVLPASTDGLLTFDGRSHALYWDDDGPTGPHAAILVAILEGVARIGLDSVLGIKPTTFANIVGLGSYEAIGSGLILGGSFADKLTGGDGADTFKGGGGNDVIAGGAGWDTAVFSGNRSDYNWTVSATGVVTITDNRTGGGDGKDTLTRVEVLQFNDQQVILGPTTVADVLAFGMPWVLREATPTAADLVWRDGLIAQQGLTSAGAVSALVDRADATTSVATLAYQFFTGRTPGGQGMDYLVSPTGPNSNNLNGAYFQSFSLENRYINFAVNLGKNGEGHDKFQAAYGALSLRDATKLAYQTIFGAAPTDAKVDALLTSARADYFATYGGDGANGLGTKAAMVGWLLAEAVKADVGVYALSNDAFLTDVALHNAAYGVDLIASYSQPGFIFH